MPNQPNQPSFTPTRAALPPDVHHALSHLEGALKPRLARFWTYYRNPMAVAPATPTDENPSDRPYRQGQEWGLPARITGYIAGQTDPASPRTSMARKEVVVENDIGWRIDAMVDYLFGKPLVLNSAAPDPARAGVLTRILRAVFAAHGDLAFLQQLALLGAVYGYVDVVVKLDPDAARRLSADIGPSAWQQLLATRPDLDPATATQSRAAPEAAPAQDVTGSFAETALGQRETLPAQATPATDSDEPTSARSSPEGTGTGDDLRTANAGPGSTPDGQLIERLARLIRFEIVHPSCSVAVPVGSAAPSAFVQTWRTPPTSPIPPARAHDRRRWWQRALGVPPTDSRTDSPTGPDADPPASTEHLELLLPDRWYRYADRQLIAHGDISLGRLPVVHIQNMASAFEYAGRSDVEPLIPLQDELNTRLSDRAYRITMTSFRMYLGKGIDNFLSMPVGPGRMWSTDNESARIETFGGDERCPSEEQHISDLRDALDKTSGVPPVAAGAIKDRIGQLSSAAALRVTLQSLLAKTERKRATYGRGLADLCDLALAWLDAANLLPTTPPERRIDLQWPSAVPENTTEKLREAEIKSRLGVDPRQVLREIGY